MTYTFTVVVQGDADEDALFEAGCDDALLGRAGGEWFLDFDREAADVHTAIWEAVMQIASTGLVPRMVRIDDQEIPLDTKGG